MMSQLQAAGDVRRFENYHSYNDLVHKATDVDRIASDEYFRVLKTHGIGETHPKYRKMDYYCNYNKQNRPKSGKRKRPKFTIPFPDHDCIKGKDLGKVNKMLLNGNLAAFKQFVNKLDVQVPTSTLYTIDKVVRDRLREGRFGIDFSEYINIEKEEEHKYHYYHHEMLRSGKTSIQIPYVPHSIMLAEKLAKSPILPENRQTRNPSRFKSIRDPKTTKRAKTVGKYGSCRKGKGTAKEEFSDWRMRKQATDRLKNKLIEQAKDEIRKNIYNDMLQVFQMIRGQEPEGENENVISEQSEEIKEQNSPPTFAEQDFKEMTFKNFQEFCLKTRKEVYPNPLF